MGIDWQCFVRTSHLSWGSDHGSGSFSLSISYRIFSNWSRSSLRHLDPSWKQSKVFSFTIFLYRGGLTNILDYSQRYKADDNRIEDSIWNSKTRQLRVDCVGASKGLFIGLFFLTASLLCLVLFFIFAPQPQFHRLGLFLADAAHCTLLIVSLFAMAIGAYR